MSEESRLKLQEHYLKICRERGWIAEDGSHQWPSSAEDRAAMARELFGLALISDTDAVFNGVKEQLDAVSIDAAQTLKGALETLRRMSEEQKAAILTLVDDILDAAVHRFALELDRFDHGFLSLRFQCMDEEEFEPQPGSEVEINPFGLLEMFQDALRWKEEFTMGPLIGRPKDPRELGGPR